MVLSFYHVYFFFFMLILLVAGIGLLAWTGVGGLRTSLVESDQKYDTADFLREQHRTATSQPGLINQALDQINLLYITAREAHFRIKLNQNIVMLILITLANAVLLGIGGWLVINNQITLGRLVASEIVLALILAALDKLSGLIATFYDLMTALVKLESVRVKA